MEYIKWSSFGIGTETKKQKVTWFQNCFQNTHITSVSDQVSQISSHAWTFTTKLEAATALNLHNANHHTGKKAEKLCLQKASKKLQKSVGNVFLLSWHTGSNESCLFVIKLSPFCLVILLVMSSRLSPSMVVNGFCYVNTWQTDNQFQSAWKEKSTLTDSNKSLGEQRNVHKDLCWSAALPVCTCSPDVNFIVHDRWTIKLHFCNKNSIAIAMIVQPPVFFFH